MRISKTFDKITFLSRKSLLVKCKKTKRDFILTKLGPDWPISGWKLKSFLRLQRPQLYSPHFLGEILKMHFMVSLTVNIVTVYFDFFLGSNHWYIRTSLSTLEKDSQVNGLTRHYFFHGNKVSSCLYCFNTGVFPMLLISDNGIWWN